MERILVAARLSRPGHVLRMAGSTKPRTKYFRDFPELVMNTFSAGVKGTLRGVALVFLLVSRVALAGSIDTISLCGASYCTFTDESAFVNAVGSNPLGQENFGAYPPGVYNSGVGVVINGFVVSNGPVGGGKNVTSANGVLSFNFGNQGPAYYYGYSYADISTYDNGAGAYIGVSNQQLSLPSRGFLGVVSSTPLDVGNVHLFGTRDGQATGTQDHTMYVDDLLYKDGPGINDQNPLYPDQVAGCGTGKICWFWYGVGAVTGALTYDPSGANAYTYQTLDGSLFTSVGGFPSGFASPFDVASGGTDFGLFSSGQTLTFPNGGVSQFTVSGIDPAVDGSSPTAFPLRIGENTIGANFEATAFEQSTAAPEPKSWTFCAITLTVLFGFQSFVRHRRSGSAHSRGWNGPASKGSAPS